MVFSEAPDELSHLMDLARVKADSRFVEDYDLRKTEYGLGETDTLPVAFRQVLDEPVLNVHDLCELHGLLNALLAFIRGDVLELSCESHVFERGHVAVYGGMFRQVADAALRLIRFFLYVVPVHDDLSAGKADITRHDVHGGRLARAVRPEEAVYTSFFDGEAYVVDRIMVAVLLDQIPDLYQERLLLRSKTQRIKMHAAYLQYKHRKLKLLKQNNNKI